MRGAGHHGGQGAVGHVDCGVAYGGAQVISNKNVPELNGRAAAVRHTEHRNRAQNIRYAHPQDPRTGLAPFGFGLAYDDANDNVGRAIKNTRDQHDQTDGNDRNTAVIRIEQGEQRGDHTEHNVAGGIA